MRTTVGIVGRGPAGPLLARPPRRAGVDRVVPESGTRACAERRLRAGTLEPGTVEAVRECGTRGRLGTGGMPHRGSGRAAGANATASTSARAPAAAAAAAS
ncbi:FAD-dependent monooxygenase [Streptomyces sp. NPDC088736]|uniref:FAD-dependent monooxygenase n=2 Tax=unclassified Streptomyces TaxID=2593676 RepID=UPI0038127249